MLFDTHESAILGCLLHFHTGEYERRVSGMCLDCVAVVFYINKASQWYNEYKRILYSSDAYGVFVKINLN